MSLVMLAACAADDATTADAGGDHDSDAVTCAWPATFAPDTDWQTETAANTANNGFPGNADPAFGLNGDAPAARVSTLDLARLLYPGATTRVYGHLMAWFDHSGTLSAQLGRPAHDGHKDAGYDSYDPAQIDAQIADMVSRGMRGVIINWKGPDRPAYLPSYRSFTDITIKTIRDRITAYNAAHGASFELILQPEAAQGSSFATSGCATTTSCTNVVVSDLTYLYNNYIAGSAIYSRWSSRPLILFFEFENPNNPQAQLVDWTAVRSRVPGNPLFIFRNRGSFARTGSDGAFDWLNAIAKTDPSWSTSYWSQDYIDNFFHDATTLYATKLAFGSGFAGFDDRQASWSADRVIPRHCGRVWLDSWAEIGKYYSTTNQLDAIEPVTWNDYEEGTEIETGIDNCYSLTQWFLSSTLPNTIKWAVDFTSDGSERTVFAYKVYAMRAADATLPNPPLQTLGSVAWTGTTPPAHQLDLSCKVPKGHAYKLFVKAVGQPSIHSHMSTGISWTP